MGEKRPSSSPPLTGPSAPQSRPAQPGPLSGQSRQIQADSLRHESGRLTVLFSSHFVVDRGPWAAFDGPFPSGRTAGHKSKPMTATDSTAQNKGAWMALTAAFLGWMFDGMEMGIFPLVARPALQEMQAVTGALDEQFVQLWMGRITALFLLGAAGGGLVFGWLGDRIGRVRAMSLSILAYSLFTGLAYFAREPWHLGLFRFVAALGMGGEWSLGVALVMECWPSDKRPLMAGVKIGRAHV